MISFNTNPMNSVNTNNNLTQWQSAEISHPGNVRNYNEDACLILEQPLLWVVADGMGGHEAGDVASNLIMQEMKHLNPVANNSTSQLSEYIDNIDDTLSTVNQKLRTMAREQYNNRTIGSTVVTMIAHENHIAYLWAGDSRLYRIRNQQMTRLTTDHSEVQNLIDQNLLLPEEAESHPSANVITRAIGAVDNLYLSVGIEKIQHDDIYLLCSDGLYRDITEEELLAHSLQKSPQQITTDLMNLALSREAKDNITIVVTTCAVSG